MTSNPLVRFALPTLVVAFILPLLGLVSFSDGALSAVGCGAIFSSVLFTVHWLVEPWLDGLFADILLKGGRQTVRMVLSFAIMGLVFLAPAFLLTWAPVLLPMTVTTGWFGLLIAAVLVSGPLFFIGPMLP